MRMLPQVSALVPAAGAGTRLGLGPKALLAIAGKPVLRSLVDRLLRVADEVILAVPPAHLERFASAYPDCRCIAGGGSRQDSVQRLVQAARCDWVLLQDAARPFASEALLREVAMAALETGCAGAFLDPEVPVARISGGFAVEAIARDQAGVFQAPQAFSRALLLSILDQAAAHGWCAQSTLQLALRAGVAVRSVRGEKTNIKLTTPEDWTVAQQLGELLQ
ncbi:MAG TPA: 2-C-methyl-D-erythritol 4-phosphate cytidylyltransferase [Pseudoxanthomonas sp.]